MSTSPHQRRLTWLAYATMLVLGINVGWLGPFLPQIAAGIHQSLDRTGLILSAIAGGYFVALPATGAIGHRRGPHFLLIIAMLLDTIGFLALALAPGLPIALCAAAAIGFAQTAIDIATNALVVELNRDRLTAALNYLHVMFGVGATLGPAIDSVMLTSHVTYRATFAGGSAATAILAVILLAMPRVRSTVSAEDGGDLWSLLKHPLIWVIATVLFLYVGAEVGVGAWLFTWLRVGRIPLAAGIASASVSIYWAGLIGGRLAGAALANRFSAGTLAAIGAIVSVAAFLALIFLGSTPTVAVPAVALAAIGFGPIFPNMIAVGAELFPARVATMTSIVAGGAALGGVTIPWAMGVALVTSGRTASIAAALASTIAMVALLALVESRAHNRQPSETVRHIA